MINRLRIKNAKFTIGFVCIYFQKSEEKGQFLEKCPKGIGFPKRCFFLGKGGAAKLTKNVCFLKQHFDFCVACSDAVAGCENITHMSPLWHILASAQKHLSLAGMMLTAGFYPDKLLREYY